MAKNNENQQNRNVSIVKDSSGNIERYNVFNALMVMRCSKERKMYLYDILELKKK